MSTTMTSRTSFQESNPTAYKITVQFGVTVYNVLSTIIHAYQNLAYTTRSDFLFVFSNCLSFWPVTSFSYPSSALVSVSYIHFSLMKTHLLKCRGVFVCFCFLFFFILPPPPCPFLFCILAFFWSVLFPRTLQQVCSLCSPDYSKSFFSKPKFLNGRCIAFLSLCTTVILKRKKNKCEAQPSTAAGRSLGWVCG